MTSGWRVVELGAGLTVKHGFAFKGEFFRDSGEIIVLTPGNFVETGGFKYKSKEKFYEGPVADGYLLRRGDVVVAMTEQSKGLLGSTATVPADNTFLHNQRLGLLEVTDPDLLDLRYCYHLLNSPDARNQIQATATGSKVRHTAPERIEAIRVVLPDLDYQRKVAGALDSIESLIENNQRRIEMLEEMARLIYREWFMHFRFPGHADVELVDSDLGPIPEGWDVARLEECCRFQDGRAIAENARGSGGVPVYGANGVIGTTALNANAPSCTVMGKIGSCGALHRSVGDCWVTNNAFAVLPGRWEHPLLVWLGLREIDFKPLIGGAANPYLPVKNFGHLPQCVPPSSVIGAFVELVAPMYALVDVVRHQNEVLAATRDLLLPRLISGELDVSGLHLDLESVV